MILWQMREQSIWALRYGVILLKVFIDGEYGTTGLHLAELIGEITEVELLSIPVADKKNIEKRREFLNSADVVFLCLPDGAAIEAASMVENTETVIIDCSTAHRTKWTYGFAELDKSFRQRIENSNRITNPGCHATGFSAIVYPLVKNGIIDADEVIYSYALTGYSGGGREKIEEYEENDLRGASIYALGMQHKHLPEMQRVCGLNNAPIFSPVIVDVARGMLVSVMLEHDAEEIYELLHKHYVETNIEIRWAAGLSQLDMEDLNGTDDLVIYVSGNSRQALVVAQLDNLGKGASGAAIQNFKIRMGLV
jgi:N-acetyl-gamma-glutamyl-phosphate reductase